jgi:uncharacterized membrane protein YjjB (DUF3815 family)
MNVVWQACISFTATLSFAVLFYMPKRALLPVGMVGTAGWVIFDTMTNHQISQVAGSFVAALIIAFLSELLARIQKIPVIVYTVAGIVPLVPGSMAFATMTDFVKGDYTHGLATGAETMLIAGAIATGLVIAGTLMRVGWRRTDVSRQTSQNPTRTSPH